MKADRSRHIDPFQGVVTPGVAPANLPLGTTGPRFCLAGSKTGSSRARVPKRPDAFDYRVSTAPWLFRSGTRTYTTRRARNHNPLAASLNNTMATPYFRCQVVRRMGSTSPINGKMREKGNHRRFRQVGRMTQPMKTNKLSNPSRIRLFSAYAVMPRTNSSAELFKQFGCHEGNLQLWRLRYRQKSARQEVRLMNWRMWKIDTFDLY